METTVKIINKSAFPPKLQALAITLTDFSPVFRIFGERLMRSTEKRFQDQGPDPTGKTWRPLADSTMARKRVRKILTETSGLRGSIRYQILGPTTMAIGTNKVYAAVHQYGGTVHHAAQDVILHFRKFKRGKNKGKTLFSTPDKAHYGKKVQKGAYDTTIPARPFLGVTEADRKRFESDFWMWIVKKK